MRLASKLKPAHLRLITKIAETGKLQTAAEFLAMSQPAASRILADVETEAGAPLFLRQPKGMELTPIGAAFIKHARVILAELDNLEKEVSGINTGLAGEVRVGSVTGPAAGCLMPAILKVQQAAPDIEVTVEVGPSTSLIRGLDEGRFDFVIARLPPEYDSAGFRILPARTEEVALIVRGSHPLAGERKIPLGQLATFPWVIQERGSPIRQAVEGAFVAAGVPIPKRVTQSSSLLVMLAMIEKTDVVVPITAELAALLTREPISAALRVLNLADQITVSPYFIIQNRRGQLPRAAEQVLQEVLLRL